MQVTTTATAQKYEFTVPVLELPKLRALTTKLNKALNGGVSLLEGDPYSKVYKHPVRHEDGNVTWPRMWHVVSDVIIILPDSNDWLLVATFKNGAMAVADPSKKIEFVNPEHGADYCKCDACGHRIKNSFVIRNKATGEELQVGCECLKGFGLDMFTAVADLTRELNRVFDYYCSDEDGLLCWRAPEDPYASRSVEVTELLRAAKFYYNDHKVWQKSETYNGHYYPSPSSEAIKSNLDAGRFDGDDDYIREVIKFTLDSEPKTMFAESMRELAANFYGKPSDAAMAYFMIKSYEDHLANKRNPLKPLEEGELVHVVGTIESVRTASSRYGVFSVYTILTSKGYTVKKAGKVDYTREGEKSVVDFYAKVKYGGRCPELGRVVTKVGTCEVTEL